MAKPRSRAKVSGLKRLNPKRLFLCGLFLLACGTGIYTWHHFAPPETREKIEAVTLNVIDVVRESSVAPKELVFWLDLVADKIPLAHGKVVAPGAVIEADSMVMGGTPKSDRKLGYLENRGYIVGYDEERRNPAWVAYRVFKPKFDSGKRPEKFEPDSRTRAKVDTSAYLNSGYDRGHMAPNRAIAVCYGPEAQLETFLMSNVVPQKHGLNAGFWESMEARVIERYTRRFGELWIICGPVYTEGKVQEKIGEGVVVPDAFFLIVSDREETSEGGQGGVRTEAFLVPHRDLPKGNDPSQFLVSVREIERRTGLDFFPVFPKESQDALESEPAKRAW